MEAAVQASAVASKRVVFVGGLADGANVSLLRAAMIPFGPIASVDMVSEFILYYILNLSTNLRI